MSDFTRRSFLTSQTDKVIVSQPTIYGTVHINLDGEFDDMPVLGTVELAIETESTSGSIEVQQWDAAVDDLSLAGIVEAINDSGSPLYPYIEASAYEGVLTLATKQSGYVAATDHAFLTIHPQTSGALVSDLSVVTGFALHPHPTATIRAGDLISSPVRAMTQGNRPKTAFIARGEDRTGENFNRALHRLSKNLDNHQVKLIRGVASPVVLEIPEGSARYRVDSSTDRIIGVQLTADFGDDLDAVLGTGIYIGGTLYDASLHEIAKIFSVLDGDWNEISVVSHDDPGAGDVKDSVVRVGTVAYVPSSPPVTYSDSDFEVNGDSRTPLSNDATFDSYRSVLDDSFNQPLKATSTISEIVDGATVVCAGATFVTNLVEPGDIAIISGSGVTSPINHDGEYIVDVVVSETDLVLRPVDADSLHLLNNEGLGDIEIRPNDQFETSLYLGFEPPLPRVPEGGIKIVLGMEDEFGDVPRDVLLVPAINSAEEVDGWVLKNLFRNLNLEGIYQGQGQDKGSGFHADVTHRAFAMHSVPSASAPSSVRTGASGEIQDGTNWFTIGISDEFTLEDVGRSFTFTKGVKEYSDWRIARLIDARTVELVPPPHQIGQVLPDGAVSAWEIFDTMLPDFQAAIHSVTEGTHSGGFHHTKVNDSTTSSDLSFAHLEHVTDSASIVGGGSPVTDLGELTGTFLNDELSAIVDSSSSPVNPDDLWGIHPVQHGSTSARKSNTHGAKTYVKVTSTTHVGFYELFELQPLVCVLRNLDGTAPSVAVAQTVKFAFYTLRMGVGVPIYGHKEVGRAALSVHQDGGALGTSAAGIGIRAGWTGYGSGILITGNEENFTALYSGAKAHVSNGPALHIVSYAPAYGALIEVRGTPADVRAEGRGESGVQVVADTSAHDLTMAESDRNSDGQWMAGGVNVLQVDKDPAGVFVRDQNSGEADDTTDLHPAAMVVEDWGPEQAGAGRGMSIRGDVFAWGGTSAYFDESVTGLSVYAYADEYRAESSNLGAPDVLVDSVVLDVVAPDYAEFNFTHDYVVVADTDVFTEPSRTVNCILKGNSGGSQYEGTVVGAKSDRLAIRATAGSDTDASTGGGFIVNGTRWYRGYLNIADYSFLGTGLTLTHRAHRSLLFVGEPLYERTGATTLDFSVSARPEAIDESLDSGAGKTSSRIGAIDPSTAISDLDGETNSTFADNYRWTSSLTADYWEDSWTDAGLPASAIQHQTESTSDDGDRAFSEPGDHITAFNRDFFLVNGDFLTPTTKYGGSIQISRADPGTLTIAKVLGSYTRKDHLSVRVQLRVAATGSSDSLVVSLGTLSRDGLDNYHEIAAASPITLAQVSAEEVEQHTVEINLHTESNFHNRESDFQPTSINPLLLVVALEIDDADTLLVVECEVQENQRPVYLHGPRVVAGSLGADKFRYTSAVRGFDTRGPQDADFLFGLDYALGGGFPNPSEYAIFGEAMPAVNDSTGERAQVKTKLKNTPWCYADYEPDFNHLLTTSSGRIIHPNFEPRYTFFKGADAAAITASSTAFDPAGLVLDFTSRITTYSITERQMKVSFPGKTGFMIPVNPPHGSLMTSLLVNMSFLPGSYGTTTKTVTAAEDVYWGVYRSIGGVQEGEPSVVGSGNIDWEDLIAANAREKWEDGAGVKVHLWRHRVTNERVSGVREDSWVDTNTQSYGYPELIYTKSLYLGDPPSVDDMRTNPTMPADEYDFDSFHGTYGGKEVFASRNYDLTQSSSLVGKEALLIADRRRFSYFVTLEFYIGARVYEGDGSISSVPEIGKNEWHPHGHPYYGGIPTVIAETHGEQHRFRGVDPSVYAHRWGQPAFVGSSSVILPVAKFRGLRLGYLTSSPSHGGW